MIRTPKFLTYFFKYCLTLKSHVMFVDDPKDDLVAHDAPEGGAYTPEGEVQGATTEDAQEEE